MVVDAIKAGAIAIPARPGPVPGCSGAEIPAISQVRLLLGRRSEAGFSAEVTRDWAHLVPCLPHQSEFSRRARWLWGAFEQFRAALAARLPEDDCQQIDTSAAGQAHLPGPRPGRLDRAERPACPVRPRCRARRVVLRRPPGGQDRPRLPHRAGLEHRARRRHRT